MMLTKDIASLKSICKTVDDNGDVIRISYRNNSGVEVCYDGLSISIHSSIEDTKFTLNEIDSIKQRIPDSRYAEGCVLEFVLKDGQSTSIVIDTATNAPFLDIFPISRMLQRHLVQFNRM